MNMKTDYKIDHHVKSQPAPFSAVWNGEKMHEIRFNDRLFKVSDICRLSEWNPDSRIYRGRAIDLVITYIRVAPDETPDTFGLLPGFCVFDFLILNRFRTGGLAGTTHTESDEIFLSNPPFTTMKNPEA